MIGNNGFIRIYYWLGQLGHVVSILYKTDWGRSRSSRCTSDRDDVSCAATLIEQRIRIRAHRSKLQTPDSGASRLLLRSFEAPDASKLLNSWPKVGPSRSTQRQLPFGIRGLHNAKTWNKLHYASFSCNILLNQNFAAEIIEVKCRQTFVTSLAICNASDDIQVFREILVFVSCYANSFVCPEIAGPGMFDFRSSSFSVYLLCWIDFLQFAEGKTSRGQNEPRETNFQVEQLLILGASLAMF